MIYASITAKLLLSTAALAALLMTPAKLEGEGPAPVVVEEVPPAIEGEDAAQEQVIIRKWSDCNEFSELIKSYDWPGDTAVEICSKESGGLPDIVGDGNTEYVSCGLFQIRTLPGRPTCDELKDPELNVEWAYKLWKERGWYPWLNTAKTLGLL